VRSGKGGKQRGLHSGRKNRATQKNEERVEARRRPKMDLNELRITHRLGQKKNQRLPGPGKKDRKKRKGPETRWQEKWAKRVVREKTEQIPVRRGERGELGTEHRGANRVEKLTGEKTLEKIPQEKGGGSG